MPCRQGAEIFRYINTSTSFSCIHVYIFHMYLLYIIVHKCVMGVVSVVKTYNVSFKTEITVMVMFCQYHYFKEWNIMVIKLILYCVWLSKNVLDWRWVNVLNICIKWTYHHVLKMCFTFLKIYNILLLAILKPLWYFEAKFSVCLSYGNGTL